jgi:7-carboxy-7-deazaguanine synthase
MPTDTLPLAPQGVYWTLQGEGALAGLPTGFVRLAGCSVGCAGCDTDYSVAERASVAEIVRRCVEVRGAAEWGWVTGGEPSDHDLTALMPALQDAGFRVALATAGVRPIHRGKRFVDFLSVSPHSVEKWVQRRGDQINLVPGLNGLRLADFEPLVAECEEGFTHRYVTPCDGKPETFDECLAWVKAHPGFRIGAQLHKVAWRMP